MSVSEEESFTAVRACWEVAALAQFYRVVAQHLNITDRPDIEQLERHLIGGSEETLVGLLPPLLGLGPEATADNCWCEVASRLESGEAMGFMRDAPPSSFASLSPCERGKLLYCLADAALSFLQRGPEFPDPASARGEQLGNDAKGHIYWCLGDRRVYRQTACGKRKRPTGTATAASRTACASRNDGWEVAALSASDWRALIVGLKKRGAEASLRTALEERVEAIEEEEARIEREANMKALLAGRRTSSRMEAKEEEERERAAAAAERAMQLKLVEQIKGKLRQLSQELVEESEHATVRPTLSAVAVAALGVEVVDELINAERKSRASKRRQEALAAQRKAAEEAAAAAEAERQAEREAAEAAQKAADELMRKKHKQAMAAARREEKKKLKKLEAEEAQRLAAQQMVSEAMVQVESPCGYFGEAQWAGGGQMGGLLHSVQAAGSQMAGGAQQLQQLGRLAEEPSLGLPLSQQRVQQVVGQQRAQQVTQGFTVSLGLGGGGALDVGGADPEGRALDVLVARGGSGQQQVHAARVQSREGVHAMHPREGLQGLGLQGIHYPALQPGTQPHPHQTVAATYARPPDALHPAAAATASCMEQDANNRYAYSSESHLPSSTLIYPSYLGLDP
mmetsp:Transcript_39967/g.80053  ORF Transcript_39967/g.80053 Transcript_39967/m.80053 type:complete len:626 (-) Transcript_39967:741-2618(-)